MYGLEPDITTLGKVIGGGYPIGPSGSGERRRSSIPGRPTTSRMAVRSGQSRRCAPGGVARAPHRRGDRSDQRGRSSAPGAVDQGWRVAGGGSLLRIHSSRSDRAVVAAVRGGVMVAATDRPRSPPPSTMPELERAVAASPTGSRCLSALRCASSGAARPGWRPPCTWSSGGERRIVLEAGTSPPARPACRSASSRPSTSSRSTSSCGSGRWTSSAASSATTVST